MILKRYQNNIILLNYPSTHYRLFYPPIPSRRSGTGSEGGLKKRRIKSPLWGVGGEKDRRQKKG
jgi:hypothetical protein